MKNLVKKFIKEINSNYDFSGNLPERGNKKYIRIKNYEDYEFTHCIAYDIAIRNENVKRLTLSLEPLNSLSKDYFDNFSSELNTEEQINNLKNPINHIIDIGTSLNTNRPLEKLTSEIYQKLANNLDYNHIQTINEKDYFIDIINLYCQNIRKQFKGII